MTMKCFTLVLFLLALASATFSGDFVSGSATCPSSGNARVSTTGYNLMQLSVTATLTNAGYIHLGGSSVDTSSGGVLTPGGSYNASKPSAAVNPATLYFACTVNTDTLTWIGSR